MKHINTYKGFKLNEKYEGVEVSTTRYERVHGKKPRGNGLWAFYFDPVGDEPIFAPSAMNYTDAVKWASLKARNMGKKIIYVGESVNEREYSDEQRKDLVDKGLALSDGSFPIKDLEDLKNAIQAYGRSKNQSAAAKFIAKRAKTLGAEDLIPDTEDFQKALKEAVNEGNAFLAARAKAIEEDAEEFEFNGKKYPILKRPKKVNEDLNQADVLRILDKAAQYSGDTDKVANLIWKSQEDLIDHLLSDHIPKEYHVVFLKKVSESLEQDTDEEYIDPKTLPQIVKDYVSSNYADAKITKAEADEDGFEVYLSNGLELIFTPDGKFSKAVKEYKK